MCGVWCVVCGVWSLLTTSARARSCRDEPLSARVRNPKTWAALPCSSPPQALTTPSFLSFFSSSAPSASHSRADAQGSGQSALARSPFLPAEEKVRSFPRNPAPFELSPLSHPPSSLSSYPSLPCRPSHPLAFVFLTVARRHDLTRAHVAPSNARYCAALDTSSLARAFSSLFTGCVPTDLRPPVGRFNWAMLTCSPLTFADVTRRL